MSSDGAVPAVGADFAKTGAAGGAGNAATGCAAGAVSAGGDATSFCADSRAARFTLISLIPALVSLATYCGAQFYGNRPLSIIQVSLCIAQRDFYRRALKTNRGSPAGRQPFAMRHPPATGAGSGHSNGLSAASLTKARSIQTKDSRFYRFFSFSLPSSG